MWKMLVISLLIFCCPGWSQEPSKPSHVEMPVLKSFQDQWPPQRIEKLQKRIAEVLQNEFGVSGHVSELRFQYTPTEADLKEIGEGEEAGVHAMKREEAGVQASKKKVKPPKDICCGFQCKCCPVECKPHCYHW